MSSSSRRPRPVAPPATHPAADGPSPDRSSPGLPLLVVVALSIASFVVQVVAAA